MPGYGTDCARYLIARDVIRNLLDDNRDGKIFTDDDTSLNIRMGFGKFQGGYYQEWKPIGTSYRNIYCGAPFGSLTYCTTPTSYSIADNKCILRSMMTDSSVTGATPLALALESVKTTLDTKKAADTYRNCRQRFAILLSDGADTMYCGSAVNDTDRTQYKRRRASVARAKALGDAGYRVFVIGFGANMPAIERNTLNWMAYYGGTDNPLTPNTGDKTALDPSLFEADPCAAATTTGTCDDTSTQCFATSNDPGNTPLYGYAFIAGTATELEAGLREAINYIREANYAFSQSSVASSRIADENFLYEVSFQPVNNDPMWLGHLRKYQILSDGTVGGALWDAGQLLQARDPATRVIKTYKGGALVDFTTANITYTDLGVENDTRRNEVVGYIRGESTYNKDNWKLGDIFRANPVTVGTPSYTFKDMLDGANAFAAHRANHVRSSANGQRIVLGGANDGQMHAFKTSDGSEAWSFIPPNVIPKLRQIAHASHPAGMPHVYFVDGPVSVADVWLGTGTGATKSASDWKTLLAFGLGRGADPNLWSSSSDCLSDFSLVYDATRPHYCGFYALDITDTMNPVYKWRITPSSAEAPFLGEPWSKMMIHRVKVDGNEKWVGFMGGGHNWAVCNPYDGAGTDCDKRGKGFFVIDLSNGSVLWSYTRLGQRRHELRPRGGACCRGQRPRRLHGHGLCRRPGREPVAVPLPRGQHGRLDGKPPARAQRRRPARLRLADGFQGRNGKPLGLLGDGRQDGTHRHGGRRRSILRGQGFRQDEHLERQQPREHHLGHLHGQRLQARLVHEPARRRREDPGRGRRLRRPGLLHDLHPGRQRRRPLQRRGHGQTLRGVLHRRGGEPDGRGAEHHPGRGDPHGAHALHEPLQPHARSLRDDQRRLRHGGDDGPGAGHPACAAQQHQHSLLA